jgi:hypothetical protein
MSVRVLFRVLQALRQLPQALKMMPMSKINATKLMTLRFILKKRKRNGIYFKITSCF